MTDLITVDEKFEAISEKCADKILMDSLIIDYQDSTQSAVKNILKMCKTIKNIDEKFKNKEINDFDISYFCAKVNLVRSSSTYRKFRKIGENASRFEKYADLLPSAYTVLFQIATLDSDKFEELVEANKITPSLSLEGIKKILNPSITKKNLNEVSFRVVFDLDSISESSKEKIKNILSDLSESDDVEIYIPKRNERNFSGNSKVNKKIKIK